MAMSTVPRSRRPPFGGSITNAAASSIAFAPGVVADSITPEGDVLELAFFEHVSSDRLVLNKNGQIASEEVLFYDASDVFIGASVFAFDSTGLLAVETWIPAEEIVPTEPSDTLQTAPPCDTDNGSPGISASGSSACGWAMGTAAIGAAVAVGAGVGFAIFKLPMLGRIAFGGLATAYTGLIVASRICSEELAT